MRISDIAFFRVCRKEGSMLHIRKNKHAEGELYRKIELHGRTFALYYGYYEECDKRNPLCEPIVIYPDFTKAPVYTDDGYPFVTMMQDACKSYEGQEKRTPNTTCAECRHFERGKDWFGICKCPKNRRANE